jgi:hypothetical protein
MTLESLLNTIVPGIVILLVLILIYSKAKEPIDSFFAKIKEWITGEEDTGREPQPAIGGYNIEYVGS